MISDDTISSDEVVIAAPAQLVWEVLVDFENYGLWNAFCPSCEASLELGSPVKMQVDLGFGLQEQVEYMCRIDPVEAIAWAMENKPGDPIHAVRTQYLKKLDETHCSYVSVDVFSGDALADMMELMAKPIEAGFNLCADGLKAYCERIYTPA
jgi:uncharacterized protein YndB with AHSA1/START domain